MNKQDLLGKTRKSKSELSSNLGSNVACSQNFVLSLQNMTQLDHDRGQIVQTPSLLTTLGGRGLSLGETIIRSHLVMCAGILFRLVSSRLNNAKLD